MLHNKINIVNHILLITYVVKYIKKENNGMDNLLIFEDNNGVKHDCMHIVALLCLNDDDSYNITSVTINEKYTIEIPVTKTIRTPYRSQGNYHILFSSETGPYFYKGFDGHKGNMFFDANPVMDDLVKYINKAKVESKSAFDFELLGVIEKFFR